MSSPPDPRTPAIRATDRDALATLFDLGRRVTSVLHLDELLPRIPELMSRLISFDAFAVYLLDEKRRELRIAYAVGYPDEAVRTTRLKVGEGLVGLAVQGDEPIVVHDLSTEPRYKALSPGMRSTIVVPLVFKSQAVGVLNILSRAVDGFSDDDVPIVRQFGVHVAVALANARLFERERHDAEVFETLAEIGREVSSVLELDEVLERIAQLARRVVDYRTFGILLVDEARGDLEIRLALKYDARISLPRIPLGEGLVGYAALHRTPVLVPDVLQDPRYIRVVDDVRSELVVPMLVKDRCIGVLDLESPQLDAFDKQHVEILTVLASQAAVAIENAQLYEALRDNEARLEREVRFAQRVQEALLPTGLPKRLRGVDVAAKFTPARELGGDFYDFLSPEAHGLVVAVGDVSGKGVPAALYSAMAGELVRSRTFRRRYTPDRATPGGVLAAINTILHQRQLEEYFCTLCYANFDLKRRIVSLANSGLPYPVRLTATGCAQIELSGVPLGSFSGSTYDEIAYPLDRDDVYLFCSDGIFDAVNEAGDEFGPARLVEVVSGLRGRTAAEIVDVVGLEVERFRGGADQNDDMTVVAVRITA